MEPGNRKILVYQPAYVWFAAAAVVVVLATAGYLLFESGLNYAGTALADMAAERAALQARLTKVREANSELRQQLAILERSSEIDRLATLEVRNEFAALTTEMLELRKELDFYRGIVSPKDNMSGLNIQSFELQPAARDRHYEFSIMLTQMRRNERYVRGVVEMEVAGIEDGIDKILPFARVAVGDSKALKFKFRYFQGFEGEIAIPEGFEPQRVTVRLKPSGKGQPPAIEKTVDWPP
jgi:hypothetical protein